MYSSRMGPLAFGIDIGGAGVKGAPVDLIGGACLTKRFRVPTPQPATPKAVIQTVLSVLSQFGEEYADLPIGVTLPAVVRDGRTRSAANIDRKWIDYPIADTLAETVGRPVAVLNDADAAGLAELYYGAARGCQGLVIVTTLGTGIGSAMIYDGVLVPNSELGHLEINGFTAEKRAAASVRTKEDLSWSAYSKRLQHFYETLESLFSPSLFVVGGGISRDADKYLPKLALNTEIKVASLKNDAGIIGAAHYAYHLQTASDPIMD